MIAHAALAVALLGVAPQTASAKTAVFGLRTGSVISLARRRSGSAGAQ